MFLTFSPQRPAPADATPPSILGSVPTLLTDDERMSSPTHRRRDYPRFTNAPISPRGASSPSCHRPASTSRVPPSDLGFTTAIREGPWNSARRIDIPTPSSAATPPRIPTVRDMHFTVNLPGQITPNTLGKSEYFLFVLPTSLSVRAVVLAGRSGPSLAPTPIPHISAAIVQSVHHR